MKPRRKKNYRSVAPSSASGRLRARLSRIELRHARKIPAFGEGMITYFKSDKNNCSQLLDLLEACHRQSKNHQEMIAQARVQLGRIDGLLASLGLEPNVTRH